MVLGQESQWRVRRVREVTGAGQEGQGHGGRSGGSEVTGAGQEDQKGHVSVRRVNALGDRSRDHSGGQGSRSHGGK